VRAAAKKRFAPAGAAVADRSVAARGGKRNASKSKKHNDKLTKDEVTFVLRNLATLCSNGVPLPKAIGALADERNLEKKRPLLNEVRRRLESGDTFSTVLASYESSFDTVTLSQVRVGERAGTLPDTLSQIAERREKAGKIQEDIVKKLAYPAVLMLVGVGVVGFLLGYVVPVFEQTYRSAKVPLPGITQAMIALGAVVKGYWWAILGGGVLAAISVRQVRKQEAIARKLDARILRMPLLGPWLRDVALLQLMEVLGCLMEAGFTLAEALEEAADSVANRAMKAGVGDLRKAVQRGEKFSREVERHAELFPPMVSQLIIVGEQTGKLTSATQHIRAHLQEEIKRKSDIAIGVIEPTLTISMAGAVAVILLAIYLPMFDMINTVSK
jgi:type IV pilus assembly protein PilC